MSNAKVVKKLWCSTEKVERKLTYHRATKPLKGLSRMTGNCQVLVLRGVAAGNGRCLLGAQS